MKKRLLILFMMIVTLSVSATEKVRLALSEYAWEKRQLIVFTPNKGHDQYRLFKSVQAEFREEFEDRKLHAWHVIANEKVMLDSLVRDDIKNQGFRETYDVNKNEFRLLLIGYDQGEKLRQKKVNIDYLFSEIDQMPMRMQEMEEKPAN